MMKARRYIALSLGLSVAACSKPHADTRLADGSVTKGIDPQPSASPSGSGSSMTDTLSDARRALRSSRQPLDDIDTKFESHRVPDLNGDGQPEVLHVAPFVGTANNPHYLYVSSGKCFRYAGTIWAHAESIEPQPSMTQGFRDLRIFQAEGCAGTEGIVSTFAWNGEEYAERSRIACPCIDRSPNSARPAECPGGVTAPAVAGRIAPGILSQAKIPWGKPYWIVLTTFSSLQLGEAAHALRGKGVPAEAIGTDLDCRVSGLAKDHAARGPVWVPFATRRDAQAFMDRFASIATAMAKVVDACGE